MEQELYSVDQVARRLGLHVRTVRNYVRDGRLKAIRIGKRYRIAREDLEAFMGRPVEATDRESARRQRHVEASCIVQIDAIAPEEAMRITNGLVAVANGRGEDEQPLHVDTIYYEERGQLKVVVTGNVSSCAGLLNLVNLYMEQR